MFLHISKALGEKCWEKITFYQCFVSKRFFSFLIWKAKAKKESWRLGTLQKFWKFCVEEHKPSVTQRPCNMTLSLHGKGMTVMSVTLQFNVALLDGYKWGDISWRYISAFSTNLVAIAPEVLDICLVSKLCMQLSEKSALLHFHIPLFFIDDSSWKNVAESFPIALTLTLSLRG